MSYVFIKSEEESNLYTVGFFDPKGEWYPESDHSTREEAADRVSFLNGGKAAGVYREQRRATPEGEVQS